MNNMRKDYLLLLARRESKEMLGNHFTNLWILSAVLVVALVAVSFSWAGKKYLEYKMQPATSSSAGKIIDYKKNAFFNVKTTKYILDCSNSTLQRLSSKGKRGFTLHKTGEKGYIVRILNRYLKKHHHKAESREASVSSSGSYKWLTGAEAAHELNCSQSKIKILRRKGKITYIQNSPRIIRYCPEDIKKMKQI